MRLYRKPIVDTVQFIYNHNGSIDPSKVAKVKTITAGKHGKIYITKRQSISVYNNQIHNSL